MPRQGAVSAPPPSQTKAQTGIEGLDDVLAGGLTEGRLYLIEGAPGSGKTRIPRRAPPPRSGRPGRRRSRSGSYEDWTVEELKDRARELEITGYSDLRKDELIEKLRNH